MNRGRAMRMLLFFLAFSFLIASCKKEYHVVGRVYNPVTDEGFSGIKVEFTRTTIGELPGGFEEVTSTLTDANGFYEIKYKGRAERVQPEPYNLYLLGTLENGTYKQVTLLDPNKIQWVDWHIVPYGELKTNLKNINCEDAADVITIDVQYRAKPSDQIFQQGVHYGCIEMSGTASDIPMGYYDFTWTVTKTSTGTNTYTGEVFVPAGGIGEFTINY